jgi:hypothetical protein
MHSSKADTMRRTRPPCPPPIADPWISTPPGHVSILHPGYGDEREIFHFLAYDKSEDGKKWIDYNFVYDMCMALTGHACQGFFTSGRAPCTEKASTKEGILEAGAYYFQVGSDLAETAERYPVLRSFRDYVFREEHVGPHWRAALPSEHNFERQRPNACILRGQPHAEDAHLVPVTEWEYWKSNQLHLYALQPGPRTQGRETYNPSNMIRLSSDLHRIFDAGHFVLIPVDGKLQCQWIRRDDWMAADLHSRPVRGGCHIVAPEYAYLACIYRATALMQESFFESRAEETVVLTHDGTKLIMNGAELGSFREGQRRNTSPTKGGSLSGSERKRSRPQEDNSEFPDDDIDSGVDLSELCRGRRRTTDLEKEARMGLHKRRRLLKGSSATAA